MPVDLMSTFLCRLIRRRHFAGRSSVLADITGWGDAYTPRVVHLQHLDSLILPLILEQDW